MTPLILFLLACAAVYIGTVEVAFGALMQLPRRLNAERHGQMDRLGYYLDEPVRLFIPVGLLQALVVTLVTMLASSLLGQRWPGMLWIVFVAVVGLVLVCAYLVPFLLVRGRPEQVLDVLLPSFHAVARALSPLTNPLARMLESGSDAVGTTTPGETEGGPEQNEIDEQEERELLQSVVEFGDTLVREVMTPRPDIVAVRGDATLAELREVFIEQQYSRVPVYEEELDDIRGFVFVKDLVALTKASDDERVIERLMRPAHIVPEGKRVAALLKEFQQQQVQIAIVHDEYGGTAGLVTIEDLLEEIVGEIRDEYDVEAEPIVDEGEGSFVFAGTVSVNDMAERLELEVERQGFETVGGYLLTRLGRVPHVGETLVIDQIEVEILDGEQRRVQRVRMRRHPESVDVEDPS